MCQNRYVLHEVFVIGGKSKGSYMSDKSSLKFLMELKFMVDVDLKLMGTMKIPKLLDKSKLSSN